jgi:predicted ATPase/tetratricopeptide (TPR) repeat protein
VFLRTLGTLKLEGTDFSRATPLLLLAYLALEGQQPRKHVAELFWPKHKSTLSNLSMALSHLRKADPGLIESDNTFVSTTIECDAKLFLNSIGQDPDLELYGGAFLEGVYPESHELEEWLLQTRETLASFAQESFLKEAERLALEGHLNTAATYAEGGYKLRGAPPLDDSRLQRFYTLFACLDHPYALKVKNEAEDLGLNLNDDQESLNYSQQATLQRQMQATQPDPLPRPTTPFIGRDNEILELSTLLQKPDCQLVTLTGLRGVGKTRLALAVARQLQHEYLFKDGIYFANLSKVTSFEQARRKIGTAVGLSVAEVDISLTRVASFFADKQALLILDDVEVFPQALELIQNFLQACPHMKVLITLVERYKLLEEFIYPIRGLPVPTTGAEDAKYYDAVKLFGERASRVLPGFKLDETNLEHVITLCQLVDGFPLALELAATWVKLLPLEVIAEEIKTKLDFLSDGSATSVSLNLRAAFEQSWQRLAERDQHVLKVLSCFQQSFHVRAATETSGASLHDLLRLHDKSLLEVLPNRRFQIPRLLRLFVTEKCTPAETKNAFTSLQTFFATYLPPQHDNILSLTKVAVTLETLSEDLETIKNVWHCAVQNQDADFLRFAESTLTRFFDVSSRMKEGLELYEVAMMMLEQQDDTPEVIDALGRLYEGRTSLLFRAGRFDSALAHAEKILAYFLEHEQQKRAGGVLITLTRLHFARGELAASQQTLERANELYKALGDPRGQILVRAAASEMALLLEANPPSQMFPELSITDKDMSRSDVDTHARYYKARYFLRQGNFELAREHLETLWQHCKDLHVVSFLPFVLDALGLVLHAQQKDKEAETFARMAYKDAEKHGSMIIVAGTAVTLARILPFTGQGDEATLWLYQGLRWAKELNIPPVLLKGIVGLANQHIAEKRFAEALQLLEYALSHPATMRIEDSHIQQLLDKYGQGNKKLPSLKDKRLEDIIETILKNTPVSKTSPSAL